MSSNMKTLPLHFQLRALTADYVVALFKHFTQTSANDNASGTKIPGPPNHLDATMAADCRAVAAALGQAVRKKYQLSWDAHQYIADAPKVSPYSAEREDRLLHSYPPLLPATELIGRMEPLPIIDQPAIITDGGGNALVWTLPGIIPPHRQAAILKITEHIRADLKTKTPPKGRGGPNAYAKGWRTAPAFFTKGGEWGMGATLLYPAGFQIGQTHSPKGPTPSLATGSHGAAQWMKDFQTVGGLLDGILAVVHPDLYQSALSLMAHLYAEHPASRAVIADWPTCYSAVQIIANRESLRHRDTSAAPGWLDLLLTLGTYGETGVMELRNLGASLSYDAGSVVLLSGRLVVHGVPKVPTDRVCLAFYMHEDVFDWAEMEEVGMSNVEHDVIGR